jgi:glutamate 5-kinase
VRAPIVVKLGSALIATGEGEPQRDRLADVASTLAEAIASGERICVVSSGAIALGRARSGLEHRPQRSLAQLQAASALGQAELQRLWQDAFAPHGLLAAQVLLTASELGERRSYLNVRNALQALFQLGAVPILNENDTTATDEISFGDNDILAAQVAVLLRARKLLLLTSVDGVLTHPPDHPSSTLIADGREATAVVVGAPSRTGRGGIASKVRAAELAAAGGVETVVTSPETLQASLRGELVGTTFPAARTTESAFKLWLRHGKRITARVDVDPGAAAALVRHGRSLLAVGVLGWSHSFRAGDGLEICQPPDHPIARGISAVDANELADRPADVEVVHRDKLVIL